MNQDNVAIFYQMNPPPAIDGIIKPFKPGGYSDSGADIAYALSNHGVTVITPVTHPKADSDFDWVFPDTKEGFAEAYQKGARTFWLNTVLFSNHPVTKLNYPDVKFVGQNPELVEKYDDKFSTNKYLRDQKLNVAKSFLIKNVSDFKTTGIAYPFIIKPVRGRGSQGVVLIKNESHLETILNDYLETNLYGNAFIAEEALPGDEITITVMPTESGRYLSLPPIRRTNHHDGVTPYSGVVAVSVNSFALPKEELKTQAIMTIMEHCEKAGLLVNSKAPIRIDSRQDSTGTYKIFDLNMKPNMTGPGRPGRDNQDSLCLMSAKELGWSYPDFLKNILKTRF